jgi:replicative DNA helicase
LTRDVYEYEVKSKIDNGLSANFLGEWNLMEGVKSYVAPEALLSKLKEAVIGRKALEISGSVLDFLGKGKIEEAVSHLKREAMMIGGIKQDRPIEQLTDIGNRLSLIRDKQLYPEKYMGIKIGFPTFDRHTGGLFPGELTLIAGITGLGKSTLCRSIAKGIVTQNHCKNVLHVANEEYLEQVQYKYDSLFTGIPYFDFKMGRITEEDLDAWQKFMQQDMKKKGMGQVFVKEVPAFTDASLVEREYRMLENRGIPIHVIIIDHLPHIVPIQKAWGENDERAKAAAEYRPAGVCMACRMWLVLRRKPQGRFTNAFRNDRRPSG